MEKYENDMYHVSDVMPRSWQLDVGQGATNQCRNNWFGVNLVSSMRNYAQNKHSFVELSPDTTSLYENEANMEWEDEKWKKTKSSQDECCMINDFFGLGKACVVYSLIIPVIKSSLCYAIMQYCVRFGAGAFVVQFIFQLTNFMQVSQVGNI